MAIKTLREMQADDAAEIFAADGITTSCVCTPKGAQAFTIDGLYRYLGCAEAEASDGTQVDHVAEVLVLESDWASPAVDDRVAVDGRTWMVSAVMRRQAGRRTLRLSYLEPRETGYGRRQGGMVNG